MKTNSLDALRKRAVDPQDKTAKKMLKTINAKLNSLYMKNVCQQKEWSKDHAAQKLLDYLTCGKSISLADFMEAQ